MSSWEGVQILTLLEICICVQIHTNTAMFVLELQKTILSGEIIECICTY